MPKPTKTRWVAALAATALAGGCYVGTTSRPPDEPAAVGSEAPPPAEAPAAQADPPASAPPAPAEGATAPATAHPPRTDHAPIVCGGQEAVRLEAIAIRAPEGAAVTASGNCSVHIRDCTLEAATGVVASGNARVVLEGCIVHGTVHAVQASGNARVKIPSTRFEGPLGISGNAEVSP